MGDSVELRMSVTAIKRVDPYVKEILSKSTHVALYKFNPATSEWEKTNTEGALFIYNRTGEPYHSIMILNRLNTENLIEPIVADFEYQMQAPFLLYRNAKSKIYGIWFYNREECVNLTMLLESIMDTVKDKSGDKTDKKDEVDIFRLLTKAQEDFKKTPNKRKEPQFASTPRIPEPQHATPQPPPTQNVMDILKAAQPIQPPQFALQRLMSNPAVMVEHIEKQQRSTTPLKQIGPTVQLQMGGGNSVKRENGLTTSPAPTFLDSQVLESTVTPQKLLPPMMFSAPTGNTPGSSKLATPVEPLTKNQMLQALTYLLKNDADFVIKLHEAYVKSLTDMVHH